MEYTKDLILNIRYDKRSNTLRLKSSKWTSKFFIRHKMAAMIGTVFIMFVIMDVVLVSNFMYILLRI